jgi:glycine/D-amino acid oxidase-like deaminating enzyme
MRSLAPDQIFAPDFVAEPVWWADILATEALPRDLPTGSVRAGACTHARKGWFGFTFDRLPHMGLLQDGTHFAMGCNGSGVAMAAYLGHQTALRILGRQDRPCPSRSYHSPPTRTADARGCENER